MSVNGPISPKQCYYEMDYSFYSFYWLDSLEIRLDHNSTYYRSLSKNSDVKPRISHCDSQNLQYKTHPEFWPFHRRIFKTSLYYKTRLILETRRYMFNTKILQLRLVCPTDILCNSWPLGEVLPDKEMSFVACNHAYYHMFYKNNCNYKPICNKFTAKYVITWEYITYFTFILVCSVLTHATSSH